MPSKLPLKEKIKIFKNLSRKKLPSQKQIFAKCSSSMIKDLSDIIKEIRQNSNLEISKKQWKKLKQFKVFMRKLSSKKNIGSKRKYIVKYMKGGFLSAVVPFLFSLASSALPAITNLFK